MNWSPTKLAVSWVNPEDLTLYSRRARRHSPKAEKKMKRSFEVNRIINPPIIDSQNMVLCGALRVTVAKKMGMALIPVIRIDHMTEAQKRAYIIADNRLAEEGSWDKSILREELSGLIELGYDVELTGFDSIEIDTMLSLDPPDDPDNDNDNDNFHLPEDTVKPVSRLGDLWCIGKHKALVGDACNLESYQRLMENERAQLIFSDPPYNCRIANNVSGLGRVKHGNFIAGAGEQAMPEFAQTLLRPAFRHMAAFAAPGTIAFICSDWRAYPHLLDAASGVFLEQRNLILWSKSNAGMGTFYRSAHELIPVFKVSAGPTINNFELGQGGRHRSNVWTYAGANTFRKGRLEDLEDHATVKPKRLVADALIDCSKRDGIVLDPFLGSGTTLVACEMTGRVGRGIELDPVFMDVILRRVTEATGCEPLLDGVTPFSVVAAEREAEEG